MDILKKDCKNITSKLKNHPTLACTVTIINFQVTAIYGHVFAVLFFSEEYPL